jgi:hypothetical protein
MNTCKMLLKRNSPIVIQTNLFVVMLSMLSKIKIKCVFVSIFFITGKMFCAQVHTKVHMKIVYFLCKIDQQVPYFMSTLCQFMSTKKCFIHDSNFDFTSNILVTQHLSDAYFISA